MLSHEDLLNKSYLINSTLILPSSDILTVTFQKKDGFAAVICIEYILDQDVFYPVIENGYIYIDNNGNYFTAESLLIIRSLGLATVRTIQKHIIDILLQN